MHLPDGQWNCVGEQTLSAEDYNKYMYLQKYLFKLNETDRMKNTSAFKIIFAKFLKFMRKNYHSFINTEKKHNISLKQKKALAIQLFIKEQQQKNKTSEVRTTNTFWLFHTSGTVWVAITDPVTGNTRSICASVLIWAATVLSSLHSKLGFRQNFDCVHNIVLETRLDIFTFMRI